MDLPGTETEVLRSDLKNLETINQRFGGKAAVLGCLSECVEISQGGLLLDLCTGYGDHPRSMRQWARQRGVELRVVAIDFQRDTLRLAREATQEGEGVLFVQADARQLPFKRGKVDWVFCSLALHHFSSEDAVRILQESKRLAKREVVVMDLARSRWAQIAVWLLTTLWMREPMTRHDARLSVRRAFSLQELQNLFFKAGWIKLKVHRVPWFRQVARGVSSDA
jgi:ubiquinone/menaquinone biosynthesis C-methylase UbiE